jgi:cilia- and flagella-associated protein 57
MMDVCIQRPLLVTASVDQTIRIWNYSNYKCELTRAFATEEEIQNGVIQGSLLSVAFHPSGYYLAAGFIDKFRIFHILHDRLKVYKEIQ